jgi:hypothetical protein
MISFTKLMIVSCLICSTVLSTPYMAEAQPRQYEKTVQEANTSEMLYRDFLLNLISPVIRNTLTKKYKKQVTFDLSSAQITEITRLCDKGQFYFQATIKVQSFTGAHRWVGIDTITVSNYPVLQVISSVHTPISNKGTFLPSRRNCS